ncbi:MAG: hypothetical protein KTR22_04855, partial [Flavobacteriaceae bacterium]|nr:hypothetical protein [Flavobacteriaceae bacterium]
FAIRQNNTQVFARFEFNTLNDVNEEGSLSLNSQEDIDNLIIETVGRTLSIGGSDITNLDGLSRLRTIGDLFIGSAPNLTSLEGIEHIRFGASQGEITIRNSSLTDISAITELSKNASSLKLIENSSLTNLPNLDLPENALVLIDDMPLNDVSFLQNVTDLRYFRIANCPSLTSLNGLQNLQSISTELSFTESGIIDLSELSNLSGTLERLDIKFMDDLIGINGLNGISFIDTIEIRECPSLQNVDGFSGLNTIDTVTIKDCDNLLNVDGFENVTNLGDNDPYGIWSYLELRSLPLITNVDGFSNLINPVDSSNKYRFRIYSNSSLFDLCGFNNICNELFNSGNDYITSWDIIGNGFNPNGQSIADGNCIP